MSAEKDSRCWPGYEPVPGKKPHSQGSCRPKPDARSTPGQKKFKAKRKQQLDRWQEGHPGTGRQAAQHLHGPEGEQSSQKGAAQKKAAAKKKRPAKAALKGKTTKRTGSAKTTKRTQAKKITKRTRAAKRPAKNTA